MVDLIYHIRSGRMIVSDDLPHKRDYIVHNLKEICEVADIAESVFIDLVYHIDTNEMVFMEILKYVSDYVENRVHDLCLTVNRILHVRDRLSFLSVYPKVKVRQN
jgi:hypothetical protein